MFYVGTAGWTVPKVGPEEFRGDGSHLARYAARLNGVEINSTFYRVHRAATFVRWAASVPAGFKFAVKAPRAITHEGKLRRAGAGLQAFVEMVSGLGEKLGPLLFQLPPKLEFEAGVAEEFLMTLREVYAGPVVLEPRHASWFTADVAGLLRRHEVARVAADPARVVEAGRPGGWAGLRYYRLHGSPRTYWTRYEAEYTAGVARAMREGTGECWCVFDNTASGAAVRNACEVRDALGVGGPTHRDEAAMNGPPTSGTGSGC